MEVIQMSENTWRIEDDFVRFFVLAGTKEALMIDCGVTVTNAKEIAAELTDLPIKLIVTHADGDHLGSKKEFADFYMHPAESVNYYKARSFTGESFGGDFTPITEGEVIDLGDRPIEIISIPGHTPGSIALLDINAKALYSGDSVQDGDIFMFGEYREVHAFEKSMEHLNTYRDRFDVIYPSHGTLPVQPEVIDTLIVKTKEVIAGNGSATERDMFGNKVQAYDLGIATLLLQ